MCKMDRKVTKITGITLWTINEDRTKSTVILAFSACSISIISSPILLLRKGLSLLTKPSCVSKHWKLCRSTLSIFPSPTYHAFSFLNEKNISQLNNNVLYCCLHSIWHLPWYSYFLLVNHKLRDKKYYLNRLECMYNDRFSAHIAS